MSEESPNPSAPSTAAGSDWQSALAEFVASRVALIRLESKDAIRVITEKSRYSAMLMAFSLLAWFFFLAGLIGCLHHFTRVPWWVYAMGFGALHALIAVRMTVLLKRPQPPAFPLTCEEFHKDRLWMQSLKTPNSKH
jgi:hypothetical protein